VNNGCEQNWLGLEILTDGVIDTYLLYTLGSLTQNTNSLNSKQENKTIKIHTQKKISHHYKVFVYVRMHHGIMRSQHFKKNEKENPNHECEQNITPEIRSNMLIMFSSEQCLAKCNTSTNTDPLGP
jgi:hypothetical protein